MYYSRNPVGVHTGEGCTRVFALWSLEGPNQDTIRCKEIRDGSSLGKELGIRKNVEVAVGFGVCFKDGAHGLGSAAWHG
jgi:hypothetical protein